MKYDVLTFGEGMLRLSVPPGSRLEHMERLDVHPAGAEANVAATLARLGVDVAWYSILPDTALGRRLSGELIRYGVDLSLVDWVDQGRMGVFFVELSGPPRPVSIIYDRQGSTATHMSGETFPWDAIAATRLVHVSGITPAISSSCRDLTLEVVARVAGLETLLSLDINFRSKLWSAEQARATFEAISGKIDLLIVNREDARDVFGITGEAGEISAKLQERMETDNVVLSLGENGALWRSGTAFSHVPARPATVIDRIGAGDAFAAGIIAGYLDGDLGRGVEMGTVMAALALGLHGDFLSTTRREVMSLLGDPGRSIDR
ncbi:MAG: sugar kinase [Acidimicrobiia bacterium]